MLSLSCNCPGQCPYTPSTGLVTPSSTSSSNAPCTPLTVHFWRWWRRRWQRWWPPHCFTAGSTPSPISLPTYMTTIAVGLGRTPILGLSWLVPFFCTCIMNDTPKFKWKDAWFVGVCTTICPTFARWSLRCWSWCWWWRSSCFLAIGSAISPISHLVVAPNGTG